MEAVEFRQGWSVAKNKGDVKKTKEGGLSVTHVLYNIGVSIMQVYSRDKAAIP